MVIVSGLTRGLAICKHNYLTSWGMHELCFGCCSRLTFNLDISSLAFLRIFGSIHSICLMCVGFLMALWFHMCWNLADDSVFIYILESIYTHYLGFAFWLVLNTCCLQCSWCYTLATARIYKFSLTISILSFLFLIAAVFSVQFDYLFKD